MVIYGERSHLCAGLDADQVRGVSGVSVGASSTQGVIYEKFVIYGAALADAASARGSPGAVSSLVTYAELVTYGEYQ